MMMVGVSSRTRSKKVPFFSSFSPNCSSSKRKKSNEDVMSLESVSGSKRRKVKGKSFVFPKNHEVIFIDEDEYDEDGEEEEEEEEEEKKNSVNETSDSDDGSSNDVDDEVMEEKKMNVNEISDSDDGNLNVVVDEEEVREKEKEVNEISNCDVVSSNDVDDVEKEEVREDEEKGLQKPNNVVEEEVEEEVREEEKEKEKVNEIFGNDDDGSSNDVIVDDVEVKVRDEEKKGVEEDKAEDLDPLWQECNNGLMEEEEEQLRQVKEHLSEAKDKKRGISRKTIEKKKIKTSSSVYKEVEHSDYGSATASTTLNPMKSSSSKRNEASETRKENNVEMEVKKVSHDDDNVNVSVAKNGAKPVENVNVGDYVKGKEQQVKGLGCSSSKRNEASETYKAKNVEMKVKKVSHDDDNVNVSVAKNSAKPIENVNVGDSVKRKEQHVKGLGCCSSKQNEASETHKAKNVEMKVENVSHDDDNAAKSKAKDSAKLTKVVKVGDSVEGKEKHVTGLGVGGVSSVQIKQEMVDDLDKEKMMEDKPREESKGKINIQNGVKKESVDNNGFNQRGKTTHAIPKKLSLAQYLAELYQSNKEDTVKNESIVLEMNDDGVDQKDTRQPPVCAETPSLIWSLKRVVQKTEEEKEMDKELEKNKPLWDEMERAIRESEAESEIGNLGTNRSPPPRCEHITLLDEQLGWDRYPNEGGSRRRATVGEDDVSLFDQSHFNVSDDDSKANVSHTEVTVWDKIPGVKQTLYPHQQEGFEFIWKNLAGSIELQKLKNVDPQSEGGCIISHAPGTGKTRLTIVFLKAYLKLFPKCLPIVVAPASLLLTWEEEFKKWDIGVPFHNLSSLDLSGKEHPDVFGRFDRFNTRHRNDETRMAKLISWFKETSILGISYSLYGTICQDKEKKKNQSVKERTGDFDIRKVLLKAPGLLVLDEGHTPRNQRNSSTLLLTIQTLNQAC
ncbi:hypothetical protein TSUD_174900 [Trifolium subterraneum]|uniref:SNF2 N-terminal domain-containing protein n=1 Tax=Trifolium subterraneum TaxID=3900 RepID=A0A2Z6PEY9_TRISU|nr:hypothetical protein TSUD_174900 [Trifolium subterraneum]